MKTIKAQHLVLLLLSLGLTSCTSVVVRKNPDENDRGIRYYRPKPYLFISPDNGQSGGDKPAFTINQGKELQVQLKQPTANLNKSNSDITTVSFEQEDQKKDKVNQSQSNADKKNNPLALEKVKISMQLVYLPDFAEEYSIRMLPGMGIGELNIKLDNGWNLTSVGIKTDQQTDEIIKSTADLVSSLGTAAKGFREDKGANNLVDDSTGIRVYATNIPFGFYEAVIATDPCGKKQLYGWRYIGFMPFQACPTNVCGANTVNCCDPDTIFGMVMEANGVLVFKQLHQIPKSLKPE